MKTKKEVIRGLRRLVITEEHEHAITLGEKGHEYVCVTVWIEDDVLSQNEAKQHARMLETSYAMLDMLKEVHSAAVDMGLTGRINHLEIEKLINSTTTI